MFCLQKLQIYNANDNSAALQFNYLQLHKKLGVMEYGISYELVFILREDNLNLDLKS